MGSKKTSENLKRDDSYIGMNRRKRRRNMMVAIPIIVGIIVLTVGIFVTAGGPLKGVTSNNGNGNKPIVEHFHPILTITVDGKPMTVPAQIGIDPSLWKNHSLDKYGMQAMSDGMSGMAPLHTHDSSGTLHVESNVIKNYTLGQFLDTWGELNVAGKTVKATVDGTPVSNYRNIILRDGEQIHLDVEK